MMPIAIVGLLAVVAILAWRGSKSEHKRVARKLDRATAPKPPPARGPERSPAPQTLERDPETGIYKLKDE